MYFCSILLKFDEIVVTSKDLQLKKYSNDAHDAKNNKSKHT